MPKITLQTVVPYAVRDALKERARLEGLSFSAVHRAALKSLFSDFFFCEGIYFFSTPSSNFPGLAKIGLVVSVEEKDEFESYRQAIESELNSGLPEGHDHPCHLSMRQLFHTALIRAYLQFCKDQEITPEIF